MSIKRAAPVADPRTGDDSGPVGRVRPGTPGSGVDADIRGAGRLVIDAVAGVTDIVEALHRNIAGAAPIVGPSRPGRTRGITGLAYRGVRGGTRLVGLGLDAALALLSPLLRKIRPSPHREAVLAALNGLFGDHLVATDNPLAISMALRRNGQPLLPDRQALASAIDQPAAKLLVLVHGLCMNDLQWHRDGHDHGTALARDQGYTTLYLHYNSGRRIAANGRAFAELMEQLFRQWPVPVRELVIIGHSMGGLVSRSACQYAEQAGHAWRRRLRKLVFLGTPHHGAPLERAGSWVDMLLAISPYSAPFARLGKVRSAGVQDLRRGNCGDGASVAGGGEPGQASTGQIPLPRGVQCFAVAATRRAQAAGGHRRLPGDGLVPVNSALGRHRDAALTLDIPPSHQRICFGLGHFDLLASHEVYEQLRRWLGTG